MKPARMDPKQLAMMLASGSALDLVPGSVCGEPFEYQPVVKICDQLGELAVGPISKALVVLRISKRPGTGSFDLEDTEAREVHLEAEGALAEFARQPCLLTTCGMYELSAHLEDYHGVSPGVSGEFVMCY